MEKEYIKIKIVSMDGEIYDNPLKLDECHLIPGLLLNNKTLIVKRVKCGLNDYKKIFGDGAA